MGKGENDLAVSGAEAAGAVGHVDAHQHSNDPAEHETAEAANQRLFIVRWLQEARADHQINVSLDQPLDKPGDFGRAVLPIAVYLYGHVVAMQRGIAISGLHCPANTKIKRQTDDRHACRHLTDCVVGGTVIDHQHIKRRQRPAQAPNHLADRAGFIEDRNNHQTTRALSRGEVGTSQAVHRPL